MLTNRSTAYRYMAATLAGIMFCQTLLPTAALALTSGPTQPEFSGFEPVATTNMVNDFTGSFSYNLPVISIPGPNGMGYALSLSYHNATSVEEESSWVGLGWTLNPGSIGRIKRGFPDEYKGAEVEYWNKVRDNWTVSVTKRLGVEAFSQDIKAEGSITAFTTQRYNSYSGYGYVKGLSLGIMGIGSISLTEADGKSSWGFSISPAKLLGRIINGRDDHTKEKEKASPWADRFTRSMNKQLMGADPGISSSGGLFGLYTFNDYTHPTNTSPYTAETWMAAIAGQGDVLPDIGLEAGIGGSSSVQKNIAKYTRQAYGYMYSGVADTFTNVDGAYNNLAMDYYTEKDAPYNKRDAFLGIPFSNADNFILSGEGVGGSFRLFQRRPGHFRPPIARSTTDIYHVNLDLHFGGGFGVGADLGYGDHYLEVGPWETALDDDDFNPRSEIKFADPATEDEPYFYRFADDMGGSLEYAEDDAPVQASETGGLFDDELSMEGKIWLSANHGKRSGRAGYIGFNTNSQIHYNPPLHCWDGAANYGVDVRGYAKEETFGDNAYRISKYIDRNKTGDDVGEFAITKEDGSIYVYGLPVYARDEAELQFGVQGLSDLNIKENFLAYKYGELNENADYSIVGEVRKTPYPSMYLLTEILSPDYVDRKNDGPTPDDLGGYVKFNYDREAGGNDKKGSSKDDWYRWRAPYKGLHYQKNSLSDPYDDMGTVQSGYKEIYYLNSIETRTHKAVFERSARRDAYSAETNEINAAANQTSSAVGAQGSKNLYKLDRIRLFAKDVAGNLSTLLTTVNFEYDYSLCRGLPNSELGTDSKRVGKLTLKKVWFEHEGVFNMKLSPYEFGYEYHTSTSDFYHPSVKARYPNIVNYGDNWTSGPGSEQNPDYSPFDMDCWGNYQHNGKDRHKRFIPWVTQVPETESFDPAAWQLKWIKLPSGGEIQVQYEQNDYSYVQHRPAMAMVSLVPETGGGASDNIYSLNVADLGLSTTAEIADLRDMIRKFFTENPEQIYFKFLYALKGDDVDLDLCSSEFITGYASVKSVGGTGNEIFIELGQAGGSNYTLPREVCLDFVRTSRANIIQTGTSCDPSTVGIPEPKGEDGTLAAMWELFGQFGDYVDEDETCQHINFQNSYLRVPITKAKLGGGVRVKRLLMYDPGLENLSGEDVGLYGTEYVYKTADGQSSGVATNEPAIGREENPLVGLINKRRDKNWIEDIVSADQREQFEGPLGESIMPGASVGYSRVVVRNIHQQKTGTGHLVEEFFTSKDYPFDLGYSTSGSDNVRGLKTDRTDLNGPALRKLSVGVPAASYSVSSIWRTQGFRFVLNSMNGQPKSVTKYSGEYGNANAGVVEHIAYDYYEPGEKIPVMTGPDKDDVTLKPLGKEMEVVLASRTVADISNDYGVEIDAGGYLGFLIPLPFGSIGPSYQRSETILKTHVTTKIIHYPALQKRVAVTKDGITDTTEYIGFDEKSGKAVLTRTVDGYDGVEAGTTPSVRNGSYYSVALPAWRYYPAMGQLAERQGLKLGSSDSYTVEKHYDGTKHYLVVNAKSGAAYNQSSPLDALMPGDLIEIKVPLYDDRYERLGIYHVGTIAGNRIALLPASFSLLNDFTIRPDVMIEVIRAATTNQLTTNAGSFTTYGKKPDAVKQ